MRDSFLAVFPARYHLTICSPCIWLDWTLEKLWEILLNIAINQLINSTVFTQKCFSLNKHTSIHSEIDGWKKNYYIILDIIRNHQSSLSWYLVDSCVSLRIGNIEREIQTTDCCTVRNAGAGWDCLHLDIPDTRRDNFTWGFTGWLELPSSGLKIDCEIHLEFFTTKHVLIVEFTVLYLWLDN